MGHKVKVTAAKAAEYRRLAAEREQQAHDAAHDRPMSNRQAEAKAKDLWGQFGFAWNNPHGKEGDVDWYRVGLAVGDVRDLWKPFGRGKDFAEAFLDAQRRGYC